MDWGRLPGPPATAGEAQRLEPGEGRLRPPSVMFAMKARLCRDSPGWLFRL